MSFLSTERASSMRAPISMRDVQRCNGACSHMRTAMLESGHTIESAASALRMSLSAFARLLEPDSRRPITAALLERMRDTPDTHDLWRWFCWLHSEPVLARKAS